MHVPTRLSLAFAFLIALLLALTAVAVGSLLSLGMAGVGLAAALAGMGAVAAVAVAYRMLREPAEAALEVEIEAAPERPSASPAERQLAIPATQVPPEYLAAVLRGAQIRHAAYRRAESSQALNG